MSPVALALGPPPDPLQPTLVRVVSVRRERPDTVTIGVPAGHGRLPTISPGQFNMLWVPGVGEVAISVSRIGADEADGSSGTAVEVLLHTIRAVGAATAALCSLEVGDVVGVRGPYGTSWGVEDPAIDGSDLLVIAGGLGVAPLRPVIDAVVRHHERFASCTLLMGARAPSEVLYADDLASWRARSALDIEVIVDRGDPDWCGPVGLVTDLLDDLPIRPLRTVAMVCGPELMMVRTADALTERGVPAGNIRLSLERNMKCAIAMCGHCQLGASFVCHDGPVYRFDRIGPLLRVEEL